MTTCVVVYSEKMIRSVQAQFKEQMSNDKVQSVPNAVIGDEYSICPFPEKFAICEPYPFDVNGNDTLTGLAELL